MTGLEERWHQRWERLREWLRLGVIYIPAGERLWGNYSEAGRVYHDAGHVLYCLEKFDNYPSAAGQSDEVEVALWYHDAVYDAEAVDGLNEAMSARFFWREFGDLARGQIDVERVERLILATRHLGEPQSDEEALIRDIDLAILGEPAGRYSQYVADVRREYGHMGDEEWREGRARVLKGFLARKKIYFTRHFWKLSEKDARANLVGELEVLLGSEV